jgi:hypothetical protein
MPESGLPGSSHGIDPAGFQPDFAYGIGVDSKFQVCYMQKTGLDVTDRKFKDIT